MNTIVLRESGHSYFGEIASKFISLDNDWCISLMHSINKKTYFVFEWRRNQPYMIAAQGKREDAERYMHPSAILVFNEVEVMTEPFKKPHFNNLDECIGEILTYGSLDYPFAIYEKETDYFEVQMFTSPTIFTPNGAITHMVYSGMLFSKAKNLF